MFGKRYKEVRQAGLRGGTLKDFGGSRLKLLFNNYLIALSELGYYKTLTYILNMPLDKWYEIYTKNYAVVQDVFGYKSFNPYNDEYFLSIFAEDDSRIQEDDHSVNEDEFDYIPD